MTSADAISIETKAVSNITISSAMSGGVITGGTTIVERGIVVVVTSADHEPIVSDRKIINTIGNNDFQCEIDNLSSSTQYQVRSYSINGENDLFYGDVKTFTTLQEATMIMGDYSSLTMTSFNVEFSYEVNGENVTEAGICYSTSGSPTVDDTKVITAGGTIPLTNLMPNTKCYARGYIITDDGVRYSSSVMAWTYAYL